MKTLLDVRELNIGRRPPPCQTRVRSSRNNDCTCYTRCAKTAQCCQLNIPVARVSTCCCPSQLRQVRGRHWGAAWPPNASGSGRRTCPTGILRYSNPQPPCIPLRLTLRIVVSSGNHSLGAFFPSKWLADAGSFVLHGPRLVPHGLRSSAK